jgi:hypothetical protein
MCVTSLLLCNSFRTDITDESQSLDRVTFIERLGYASFRLGLPYLIRKRLGEMKKGLFCDRLFDLFDKNKDTRVRLGDQQRLHEHFLLLFYYYYFFLHRVHCLRL